MNRLKAQNGRIPARIITSPVVVMVGLVFGVFGTGCEAQSTPTSSSLPDVEIVDPIVVEPTPSSVASNDQSEFGDSFGD